jgi:hypothetical protein
MSLRTLVSIAVVATLGIACVSTDALAYRGGVYRGGVAVRGGVYRGGVAWRGGAYRGGYVGRGVGVGLGVAAVGAAVAAPYYYGRPQCGYYPYPPCY